MARYGKQWFVREVAHRASFTQDDVRLILHTMMQILYELAEERAELAIPGLFTFFVKQVKPHEGYDVGLKKTLIRRVEKLRFRPSLTFRKILKDGLAATPIIYDEEVDLENYE